MIKIDGFIYSAIDQRIYQIKDIQHANAFWPIENIVVIAHEDDPSMSFFTYNEFSSLMAAGLIINLE